ncbi:tRNA 2-thiocytidine(32) synthetase TtcA [Oceanisphaera arctica]|uniref:tRNA-cytidine(32) 2-sulfurtransferase n=1 Tax=Oceanisphaera arctica TaxID=641510 RepID=A0A2P5TQG8_9GAMM|nr:tRNA 2-thiocytidine(32) synthetase TtcA [Oceanisphaera arctica]PPL18014.1 tRNA 2-thiocytidine(32) synthetase TtcA [Oceanisphaera arctica]GHA09216.1 tRNA 2-thiocytidine biosynthesis protein TtcA [Oceanisphaera arctica]
MTEQAISEQDKSVQTAKQDYNFNKLHKRLRRHVGEAIADFNMIEEGDRVMVCLSGGKDSYAMLDILLNMKAHAPIHFDIIAVNLDQKQPGFPEHVLPAYLDELGVEYKIVEEDTYSIVMDKVPEGKTTCSLCSRLRRGILYRTATELGATKIALGHHRDDILETLLLNMFYGGTMKSMPPKLVSDNGKHVVIRPLAYCKEKDLVRFAEAREFPIIPCNLCGSQENLQRQAIKNMLQDWDNRFPGRIESMFRSLQQIVPSHLLDHQQFDFKNITSDSGVIDGGDIGFDKPDVAPRFIDEEEEDAAPPLGERLDIIEVK